MKSFVLILLLLVPASCSAQNLFMDAVSAGTSAGNLENALVWHCDNGKAQCEEVIEMLPSTDWIYQEAVACHSVLTGYEVADLVIARQWIKEADDLFKITNQNTDDLNHGDYQTCVTKYKEAQFVLTKALYGPEVAWDRDLDGDGLIVNSQRSAYVQHTLSSMLLGLAYDDAQDDYYGN